MRGKKRFLSLGSRRGFLFWRRLFGLSCLLFEPLDALVKDLVDKGFASHVRGLQGVDAPKDFVGDADGNSLGAGVRHELKKRGNGAKLARLRPFRNLLAPIPDLSFFEGIHRYQYKGRWLPFSVSKVASPANPEAERRFQETRHIWEPRGNAVHTYCETLLKGGILWKDEFKDWTDELDDCWLLTESEAVAVEYRLCDAKKGIGGSFDFLVRTSNGKLALGDLKTVGSDKAISQRQPAKAQLGGYLAMLIDHHPGLTVDSCYTLVSGPGRYRLIKSEPDECLMAWVDAWDLFKLDQGLF